MSRTAAACKNWPQRGKVGDLRASIVRSADNCSKGSLQEKEQNPDQQDNVQSTRSAARQGLEMRTPVAEAFVEQLTGGSGPGRKAPQELDHDLFGEPYVTMGIDPFTRGSKPRSIMIQPEELQLSKTKMLLVYPEQLWGCKPC